MARCWPCPDPRSCRCRSDSPHDNGERSFSTVTISNPSEHSRSLPFDEIRRNGVLVDCNPATGAERVEPRPRLDGAVIQLAPGAMQDFQVVFEYPRDLVAMDAGAAALAFCVWWEPDRLRGHAQAAIADDWNAGFRLRTETRIVDDRRRR